MLKFIRARHLCAPLCALLLISPFGCAEDPAESSPDALALDAAPPDSEVDAAPPDMEVDAAPPDMEVDAAPPVDRFEALREALERDLARNHATAASVSVWMDEEITWVGGFGDIENASGHPLDEDTLFMIGSDTKKLAAIALLRRVEAGEVTLETTLGEVLPDLALPRAPEFTDATLHDLLSHQGGLVDETGEPTGETTDADLRGYTYGPLLDRGYALAPPGIFFNYSNPNYSMIGLVTETLGGAPWADIVEAEVFAPLGMTRTVARKASVDANHALGLAFTNPLARDPSVIPLEETWESAFACPAGLVWSTPSDQMRLARFLVDGDPEVLSDALRATLPVPVAPLLPDYDVGDYGYGLFIERELTLGGDRFPGVEAWYHGGNTTTHTSAFWILPQARFALSILSNGVGDDFSESVGVALRTLVDLPEAEDPIRPSFDPDTIDARVGTYTDPNNAGEIIVRRAGDGLELEMPLLDQYGVAYAPEMIPLTDRVWQADIQDTPTVVRFIDGPDGEAYLAHRAFVAIRPAPGAPKRRVRGAPVKLDLAPRLGPPARRIEARLR